MEISQLEFNKFISDHINDDVNALRLKNFKGISFDIKFAILQIECLQRIKQKLPSLYYSRNFLFPSVLSTEQCTNEIIAEFHSKLIEPESTVLDMTAGLCIDTLFFSKRANNVTALEINPDTAAIAKINMRNNAPNATVINCDSIEFVNSTNNFYDTIFIDPARRGDNNKRLFAIADCSPDVISIFPRLNSICNTLFIKASSMIDITKSIEDLNYCSDIWIIGINNECKELLFKIDFSIKEHPTPFIHTLNFLKDSIQEYSFPFDNYSEEYEGATVGNYIYEPNVCLMKSGRTSALIPQFDIKKLHKNTHLYTSNTLYRNFPGRVFKISEIIPFKSKEIKSINKKYPQINVSTRNFRLKPEELKKKIQVKDGGENYLFGVTDINEHAVLLVCLKA